MGLAELRKQFLADVAASTGVNLNAGGATYEQTHNALNKHYGIEQPDKEAFVNKWFDDAYNAIVDMSSYNKYYWDTFDPNYGGSAASHLSDVLGQVSFVEDYLRERQGAADYDAWNQTLTEYRRALMGLDYQNRQRQEFFGQWEDQDAYNEALKQNEWLTKYNGQSVDQLRSAADGLEDGAEKTWLASYADSLDLGQKLNYDVAAGQQELRQLQEKRSQMLQLQQTLQSYQNNPLLALMDYNRYNQLLTQWDEFHKQGGMIALDEQIAQKGAYNLEAGQLQGSAQLQKEHEQWLTTVRDPQTVAAELEQAKAQAEVLSEQISLDKDSIRIPMGGISMENAATLQQHQADYQALLSQIEELEKEYLWAQNQAYAALVENPDFAEKSQYASTRLGNNLLSIASGLPGFQDIEYDYINRNPVAVANQAMADQQNGRLFAGTDRSQLQEMTDDEIKIYNYLYATKGKDAAKEYVTFLMSDLNARQRKQYETFAQQAATSGLIGAGVASGLSILMSPMKGAAYLAQAADYLSDGKIDPNAGYNRYAYTGTAIRDAVAQQIQNNPKWGAAGSFGYQLGMSMFDFLLAAGLSGGSAAVSGGIMGAGAAADAVIEAKDRGLSDTQAFTLGTVAGLAEMLTEKYSLETLLDADLLADHAGRYILKNMAAEGSEETASSLINLMADVVISKDKSQWMQSVQQYQDMGYSKGEAFGKAIAEQAAAIGLDALGGAISGGILGGAQAIRSGVQNKGVGNVVSVFGMNDAAVQRVIDSGLTADPGSTQFKVAKEMSQKLQQGQQLTAEDKGRLARSNWAETGNMLQQNAGSVSLATAQVNVSNNDPRWQQAQRLAALTGRDIVFYNGSPDEEGYFQNGRIHINANVVTGETFAPVFAHELTHSAEMADVYEDLQRLAFQKLRNLGEDISQMRKDKMKQYEAEGHPLGSEKEADQEIVARFVQDYLLTDELTIHEVVLDSPSLGRKILNWIDGLLAKMGNENAQERVFLSNARKIYSEALKQTRNNQQTADQQAEKAPVPDSGINLQTESAEDADTAKALEEVRQVYERGELDDATYNVIVDTIQQEAQRRRVESKEKTPPNLGDDRTVFIENVERQYSLNGNFPIELQKWYDSKTPEERIRSGERFLVGTTSDALKSIGVKDYNIYFGASKIQKILNSNSSMSIDTIKEAVNLLEHPILVMKSQTVKDSIVLFGDVYTSGGKPVMLSLLLNPQTHTGEVLDYAVVTSAYGRRVSNLQNLIDNSTIHYVAEQKERTDTWLKALGLQLPSAITKYGPISSIYEDKSDVKKYSIGGEQSSINLRDNLNRKATEYLTRVESRFVRKIGNQLGIPRHTQWDIVRPVIDSMVDEFLQTGKISDETLANAFNTAYDQGKVMDREFYDQYKEVKDHLRNTPVTLSQRDRADIPDFNLWRKSMLGSLRIVNEGGLPVDVAYQELHSMAPELFPESITHPADLLQKMGEVAKQIRIEEKSLNEYYGPEAGEFRRWAQHDFGTAIADMMPELRTVKRYAEQEQKEAASYPKLKTTKEARDAFRKRKQAQAAKDSAMARNLLSEQDKRIVKQLLDGITTLEELEGKDLDLNLKGIREVYEATQHYEMIDRQIRQYQAELRQNRQDDADKHLVSSLYWKDKKNGFSFMRETMRRNILDIVTNRGDALRLLKDYFEPVQIAEAERQRFLNKYRNQIRELKLSTSPAKGDEVSEAYAVQLYGEAITSIEMIQQSRGRLKERDGRTVEDWQGLVDDMFLHSPSLDKAKIENAVKVFRQIYDEFFQRMNDVLVRNGYPPVEYRKGYFPHFQGQDDGIAAHLGKLLGVNFMDDVLPTTLNGLTHTFKPGKQWFANAQERTGFKTTYDAVEGFDKYIEGVSNVIYHTDNIQKLRALSRQIRYRSSSEGIKEEVRRIQENDDLSDYEKEKRIDDLYVGGRFALSNFVTELDEYTNILAGKKSMSDRGTERLLGRYFYTWMKHLESQIGANMVGGNIGSALTNIIPLTQAWGQLDTSSLLAGMWDTLKGLNKSDGFVARSDFLTSRHGSEKLVQTWIQKASAKAGILMEVIDGFTSESITRGAYYQNLQRGMSEAEALHQADIFAAGVMADRSKGAMPTLFEMKNPVAKIFTQFQLEVNNQMSEIFKDLPRAMRERKGREVVAMLLKYFFGAWLFNNLYEWLFGRRPALDPIGMVLDARDDLNEEGLSQAGRTLAGSVVENIPFVGGLMGGGRVPISSAIPDIGAIWDAFTEDDYDPETKEGIAYNKRLDIIGTELAKPAMLLAFPFGGNQIMKAWKGIKTVIEGGSYVINNAGERRLQYAVDVDNPWHFFGKALMASVMGKSALPEAKAWTAGGFGTLNETQTAVYDDLVAANVDAGEAYAIIDALRKAVKNEDLTQAEVQRNILQDSSISDLGKAIIYYGLLASESERELMDSLTDIGAAADASGNIVMELYRIDKLPAENRKTAQAEALRNAQLTEEEKRIVVSSLFQTTELLTESGEPTAYAKFLAATEAGLSVDSYMDMRAMKVEVDSYLEFADTGIPPEVASQIVMEQSELVPTPGYDSVHWTQRCQVVLDADLTESQKLAALSAVSGLYDSTYEKIQLGYQMGMSLQSYFDLRDALPRHDADGNGKYTAKETQAAIDSALPHLSDQEKAILWQLQNKSWKPKKNPYDRQVGQLVYDAMYSESDTESALAGDDPYALMRALSMIP